MQADLASVLNPLGDLFAWRAACSSSLPAAWVFVLTGLRLNTVGACKLPDVLWHHRLDSCRVLLSERHDRLDRFHLDPGARALGDESFFGPMQAMYRAKLQQPLKGAQWTGITTALAARLLDLNLIDAVITMKADPNDRWKPTPVIVTAPDELAQCRGMRMGYAPLLALIEPALARGLKRLAVIGIPCQVYALRALHADWEQQGLASLYVIGTPCSDNTHTERFHQFLALLDPHPETIHYLEFRADYHVELRFSDG
ncbi:MAG: hypothetical protein EBX60_01710, partial [Betaproteobacteria bacterium]|nr:hypothetical protein [Betaproteobacteria bacterium]